MRFLVEIGSKLVSLSKVHGRIAVLAGSSLLLISSPTSSLAGEPQLLSIPLASQKLSKKQLVTARRTTLSQKEKEAGPLRGWQHLYERMVEAGAEPARLRAILEDERMPLRRPLYFAVQPREPRSMYRRHNTRRARKNALKFHEAYFDWFQEAEQRFGVPQEVILSVIQIESKCGRFTGRSSVFYRLARLASASEPGNVENNYIVRYARNKEITQADVEKRAQWLEETFLPHTVAALELADRLQVHPMDVKGSPAGALGLPQFLPGNVELHGADGDNDGVIDLFNPPDAIFSVARFLKNHGWTSETQTIKERAAVVWHYNRSKSYVNTVLSMSRNLQAEVLKKKKQFEAAELKLAANKK